MSTRPLSSLKERRWLRVMRHYEHDLAGHFARFRSHEEGVGELVSAVLTDTRKLAQRMSTPLPSTNRKNAIHYVKKGMASFNVKAYSDAEEHFRMALHCDPEYSRAWCYLGNTLFKRRRFTDALTAWEQAIKVEPKSEAAAMAKEKLEQMGQGNQDDLTRFKEDRRI